MEADNSTGTPRCAGTCAVEIQGNALQGIMAVFTESREDAASDHGTVRVLVTDGHDTFEGTVLVDRDIKGERWEENTVQQKVDVLTSYLLDDKAHPNIALKLEQSPTRTIRLVMTKRTETGIYRHVFSSVLTTPPQIENAAGSMTFCQELASALQQEKTQVKKLEEELKKARADVETWKDNSNKHEQIISTEKDDLLNRFLILYKATHEKLKEAEQKLQHSSSSMAVAGAPSNRSLPDETGDAVTTEEEPVRKRRRPQAPAAKKNADADMENIVPAKRNKKPAANPRKGKGRSTATASKKDADEPQISDRTSEIPSADTEQPKESNASASVTNTTSENQGVTELTDDMDLEEDEKMKEWVRQMKLEAAKAATAEVMPVEDAGKATGDGFHEDTEDTLQWVRNNLEKA